MIDGFKMIFSKKVLMQNMVLCCVVIALPVSAMAGFEWSPAPAQSSVAPSREAVSNPPMEYDTRTVVAVPRAPVISEPLAPIQDMISGPSVISAPMPQMENKPVRQAGGLYIDPYPLRGERAGNIVDASTMDQALAEKSGSLNPVQLGGGMTTGVNNKRRAVSSTPRVNGGKSIAAIDTQSLTPFIGDEPAPLPGYGLGRVERDDSMRQYAQAVGFGKGLPLALAISQLVPSDFTHRFDGDIDASAMVDWEGGKPWNVVLNDMLRPQNMTAEIQGNVVVIKNTAKI